MSLSIVLLAICAPMLLAFVGIAIAAVLLLRHKSEPKPKSKKPRKLIAFVITDVALIAAAALIKNGNFSALATALVLSMATFVGAHAVQDFKTAGKKDVDDAC